VQTTAYPPRSSSRGFIAALSIGGVLVMAGAIAAVLLVTNQNDNKSHTGSGSGTTPAASIQAAGQKSPAPASSTPSASPTDSATSEDSGSDDSGDSGLTYKAGTYTVNQQVAEDLLGDTVTLNTVTVNGDGTVSVKITYTDAYPGEWTCANETADEASLAIDSDATDVSAGNDCTKNPAKTWYMSTGQTISGSMYFSQPPEGSGPWTFSLDTEEFQGDVSGISIPTQ
jgi:hypothetical protein